MAEDIERKVVYVYSVVDQMSKEHERMASSAKKAGDESARTTDAQKALAEEVRHTSDEISSQASLASSKASDISSSMAGAESSARRTGEESSRTAEAQRALADGIKKTSDELISQASLASSKASDISSAMSDAEASAKRAGDATDSIIVRQMTLSDEVRRTYDDISSQSSSAASKASDIADSMADAEASARSAGDATEDTITKQRELASTAQRTTAEVQAQNVSVIMQLTAIMGFRQGISSLTNSMISLGLVSDESAAKLLKFNSAFQMFSGGVQILKAAQGMMTILNASTLKNAILNTYNSVITNPGRAALVGVGIGAAAGVGAYYALSSSNSTTVSNTVTIQGTPTAGQEQTAEKVQQVYSLTGAGGYA